ncbi:MAG: hypothetical protein R3C12_00570 [Planctomycetaceae bacterium]
MRATPVETWAASRAGRGVTSSLPLAGTVKGFALPWQAGFHGGTSDSGKGIGN